MRICWVGMVLIAASAWGSEPVHACFRSPAEAALMAETSGASAMDPLIAHYALNGAQDSGQGLGRFRVESVRRDALLGRSWAVVRSCEHPERPAVVMEMLRQAGDEAAARGRLRAGNVAATVRTETPVLIAGATVQVVRVEQNVRLEMAAVAQRSAGMGERVRLRVVREAGEGEEFVEGVVRGAGLVEMESGR